MCDWLSVSRSGYYDWKEREPSATARRRETLASQVRFAFEQSDGTYGYRRIHVWLTRHGTVVDPETVRRIMRGLGLVPCQPRPWRPVTTIAGDATDLPDLLRRDFTARAPATKLVGDITYIRTWEGWLYLATVLDCFSKKVVGYAMAEHMRTELVADALRMAARTVPFRPGETIFHSDRGCQYLSAEFAAVADELGVRRSVGRTGVCYDNAWAESFNGTLKNERVNRTEYPTREHARHDIISYIELRYNQIRLHSGIDYRTPNEVESEWFDRNKAV
jgi:putative transposase